ncbi:MAG: c-type cytochrome [Bacteroidales bacterium]
MKKIKLIAGVALVAVLAVITMSFISAQQKPKAWDVPANYKSMKNPVKGNASATSAGKALWAQHCQSCHGKAGLGDGPKARNLEAHPGDFTSADFAAQSDGDLFFKTKMGRGEMPKYDKKIADEDIWGLVNYIRTLKK